MQCLGIPVRLPFSSIVQCPVLKNSKYIMSMQCIGLKPKAVGNIQRLILNWETVMYFLFYKKNTKRFINLLCYFKFSNVWKRLFEKYSVGLKHQYY